MKNIFLIAKRDLKMYFVSPIAYIVMAMYLFLIGWMFFNLLSFYAQQIQQFAAISMGQKPTLMDRVVSPLFGNISVIMLIFTPFLTMRLLAEERKDHTIELLLTAPVRGFEIVLGKFFSGLAFLTVMIALTAVFPLLLQTMAKPDWGVIATSYLGLFFLASTYVAVGLFWSSRTENQIVAAVLSFGTLFFFWLISWAAHRAGPVWSDVLDYLSVIGHYSNFAVGVIESPDIIYYLSFIGFGLFLTHLSLDADQWS